jgi:hypothetical protein
MDGQSASARFVLEVRDGKENPFWTNEAIGEHIGNLWYLIHTLGIDLGDKDKVGTPAYHLRVIEKYHGKEFQYFAALLPDVYDASDDEKALPKMHDRLTQLANEHQAEWEAIG